MPRKVTKKSTKATNYKQRSKLQNSDLENEIITFDEPKTETVTHKTTPWYLSKTVIGIFVVSLLLLGMLAFRKGMLVVAMVNGRPLFRWDLDKVLMQRYGTQTIEGMVSEALITDAAVKSGVSVSNEELSKKVDEIVKSLGGNASIDDLLKFQGMTKEDFNKQLTTQLLVQKILSKDIAISEKDVDNFIATSAASLQATDPGQLRTEARQAILDAKIGEKVQEWFSGLKANATITKFIE